MPTGLRHNWHQLDASESLALLESNPRGLDKEEIARRKSVHGPNQIQQPHKINPFFIFLGQFKDFLIIILLAATLVSLLIGATLDGVVILVIVILCALLGFFQEYRSEKAVEALKRMASPTARVIREGEECVIPSEEVVPGDIITLQTGDLIPADARIIEAYNLSLDESILTGESTPVPKGTAPLPAGEVPLGDRSNMLFASTTINRGRGKGVVTETGMRTEFGKIAGLLRQVTSETTPLEKQMGIIGKWLGIICIGVCAFASFLGIVRGHGLFEMFVWGVSLAVAAVPEALAIVKKLAAVETLGCTTVICSDKTGTLTKNEMTVQEIWTYGERFQVTGAGYQPEGVIMKDGRLIRADDHSTVKTLLEVGVLCNDAKVQKREEAWIVLGDPTEGALLVAGAKGVLDYEALRESRPRVGEIPFEEQRKMMSTIHDQGNGRWLVATKGAPEIVLHHCSHIQQGDNVVELHYAERQRILAENEEMACIALRVLALAWRELPEGDYGAVNSSEIESSLVFCGLVGMIDPPRDEVRSSVQECRSAGIRPVMVTGDHRTTARAIAMAVGILDPTKNKEDHANTVIEGEDLQRMSDQDIDGIIHEVKVFARVSPEHKLRIVEAYQRNGDVVAMTGDGVNDAPALKKADIGVAMGIKGTDVSREASDMVLADDNFSTIVSAVREGRAAFENIKKYLVFLLSCNIGEILILTGAFFLGLPIPLIALQILWVNLTTDGLPALALGIDPPDPDIMQIPPRGKDSSIFTPWLVGLITIISLHIFLVLFGIFYAYVHMSVLIKVKAQTMVFLCMILLEMFNALNCRSHKYSIATRPPWENPWLVAAISVSIALSIAAIHLPLLNGVFHTHPLGSNDWLIAIASSSTILFVVEVAKWLRHHALGLKNP